jgi:hypothetical protein
MIWEAWACMDMHMIVQWEKGGERKEERREWDVPWIRYVPSLWRPFWLCPRADP